MDERTSGDEHVNDQPDAEGPSAPVEEEDEAAAPRPPAELPRFEGLSTGKEPWKGGGCSSRLPLYGCVIGLAVVIAFLMAGTSMVRRTVWSNFESTRRAVEASLPADLPAGEAARIRRNLGRFRTVLERSDDPYPLMGEFVTRARTVFDDGRLSIEEVESLNLVLERWIEESGVPALQLGCRMPDFGFRMCFLIVDHSAGSRAPSSRAAASRSSAVLGRCRDGVDGIPDSEVRNPSFPAA